MAYRIFYISLIVYDLIISKNIHILHKGMHFFRNESAFYCKSASYSRTYTQTIHYGKSKLLVTVLEYHLKTYWAIIDITNVYIRMIIFRTLWFPFLKWTMIYRQWLFFPKYHSKLQWLYLNLIRRPSIMVRTN